MLNFILFCGLVLLVVAICFWFRARNHGLWRRILYKTHLWLGIISGIILFIVCLTGTVLVFRGEITFFLERDRYFPSHPGMTPLKIEDLIAKVEQNMNGKVNFIQRYSRRSDAAYAYVVFKDENTDHNERTEQIIDSYTGESLGRRVSPLFNFFGIVQDLHTSLLLPSPIGGIIVGSATLIFIVIALSGLCLWFPANFRNKKAWANGFLIRLFKGKNPFVDDFHKTLGFYILIPMLLMAITGARMSFSWFRYGYDKIIFNTQFSNVQLKSLPPTPDAKPLPLAYFIKKADELLENKDYFAASISKEKDGTAGVFGMGGGAFKLAQFEGVTFDKYTGEVLEHERFENYPIGMQIVMSSGRLHLGDVFGLPTQIIYFLACLIATTLPVTGVIIWWRKLRNLRKTTKDS
jgi:uncharacterized iron-regulated membrane protein